MRISYLALSEKRCTVQVAGCNFRCRGCFSSEKQVCGIEVSAHQIVKIIPDDKEIMLAGGEPTINEQGLFELIDAFKGRNVILSTNGYLVDGALLDKIGGVAIHIDLKALDSELHRWYTGKDNRQVLEAIRLLHDKNFNFEVSTVYIPGVVETGEIDNIGQFLSSIGNIRYKIIRYVPVGIFSRRPEPCEIDSALQAARKYLENVSSSIENRSHPRDRLEIQG